MQTGVSSFEEFIWLLREIGMIGLSSMELQICIEQYTKQFGCMMKTTSGNHYKAMEMMLEFILMGRLKIEIRSGCVQLWRGCSIQEDFVFEIRPKNIAAVEEFIEMSLRKKWMRKKVRLFSCSKEQVYVPEKAMLLLVEDPSWKILVMDTFRMFLHTAMLKTPACSVSMLESLSVACSALEMRMPAGYSLETNAMRILLSDMKEMMRAGSFF